MTRLRQLTTWVSLIALVTLVVAPCAPAAAQKAAPPSQKAAPAEKFAGKTVRIGVIQPLTGRAGEFGVHSRWGAELAAQHLNAAGGILGAKVDLEVADDASDVAQTTALLRKQAADSSIVAVVAPTFSTAFIAGAEVAPTVGIVYISAGSTVEWRGEFNPWTFRVVPPASTYVPKFFESLTKLYAQKQWKTTGMMTASDHGSMYAIGVTLRKLLPQFGLQLTVDLSHKQGDTDFSAAVTETLAKNPHIMVINQVQNDAALFMKQARARGYKGAFVASSTAIQDPRIYELSGGAAEGMVTVATFLVDNPDPMVQKFVKDYKAKTNQDVQTNAAAGYDAVMLIADAIKRAGSITDRAAVRNALGKTDGFKAIMGSYKYADKGDNLTPTAYVVTLAKDGWKLVK